MRIAQELARALRDNSAIAMNEHELRKTNEDLIHSNKQLRAKATEETERAERMETHFTELLAERDSK